MTQRLVEILVPTERKSAIEAHIERGELDWSWSQSADGTTVFKVLLSAGDVDRVLDPLQPLIQSTDGARVIVLPVESYSRAPEAPVDPSALSTPRRLSSQRISRDELFEDLSGFARTTPSFLAMAALAAVVAAVGLARDSAPVLIGSMVIAPLLGPNMALTLATTLGDTRLALTALRTNVAGMLVALVVAFAAGWILPLDPGAPEVLSRVVISWEEIVLALATGAAGALAVTTGVSSSLVGVMVAVALLPPLVTAGMLLVGQHYHQAASAFLLLATNVICVNLSGVVTFYVQGVRPRTWWEEKKSRKATQVAVITWLSLLVVVAAIVTFAQAR